MTCYIINITGHSFSLKSMNQKMVIKSKRKKPLVVVLGCVHGDETIGAKIINYLKKIKIRNGTLVLKIGNPLARLKNKRFIDQDLNRSFPGNSTGNHEEKLAYKLKLLISSADFVIDIHTSTTNTKPLVIVTKTNKSVEKLLNALNPSRVVIMDKNISKKALIYYCKAGLSLEYGKNISEKLITKDIMTILSGLEMTSLKKRKKVKTEFYLVVNALEKNPGYILTNKIRNFKLVKRGDVVANFGQNKLKATKDFYPILFGEKAYKDIFGFCAKKISTLKN